MLVLSRRLFESIKIGDDIEITVTRIGTQAVRLGVSCPKEIVVVRQELLEREDEK
jgi:carbon storage regulator